jgi:hypothetical protein
MVLHEAIFKLCGHLHLMLQPLVVLKKIYKFHGVEVMDVDFVSL